MNKQEIVETIQEITGMALMLGLTTPEQIQNYDALFSEKFGADIMNAFYQTTLKNKSPIYTMICQALEKQKLESAQ
jgi:hypothetical protein